MFPAYYPYDKIVLTIKKHNKFIYYFYETQRPLEMNSQNPEKTMNFVLSLMKEVNGSRKTLLDKKMYDGNKLEGGNICLALYSIPFPWV